MYVKLCFIVVLPIEHCDSNNMIMGILLGNSALQNFFPHYTKMHFFFFFLIGTFSYDTMSSNITYHKNEKALFSLDEDK